MKSDHGRKWPGLISGREQAEVWRQLDLCVLQVVGYWQHGGVIGIKSKNGDKA